MGRVYRGRDPRLGREVAVKILPASLAADPVRLLRFEQEAIAVGRALASERARMAGRQSEAASAYEELLARARTEYVQCLWLAHAAWAMGRADDRFRFFEQAFREREYLPILTYPAIPYPWVKIRPSDPRFRDLLRRTGVAPAEPADRSRLACAA